MLNLELEAGLQREQVGTVQISARLCKHTPGRLDYRDCVTRHHAQMREKRRRSALQHKWAMHDIRLGLQEYT